MSETKTNLTDLLLASKRWQGLEATHRTEIRKVIATSAANMQMEAAKARRRASGSVVGAGDRDRMAARLMADLQSDMALAMSVLVEMIDGAETAQLG